MVCAFRWIAKKIGFERIILKNGKLRCYFLDNPKSPYYESAYFPKSDGTNSKL
jgi:transcription-repair coupling factor (superfamily II helicase)